MTDIHKEAQAMVQYLEMLVKSQGLLNESITKGITETGPGITTGGGNTRQVGSDGKSTNVNVNLPVMPPPGDEIKEKLGGSKLDYAAVHAKNLEIARGGDFAKS